MIVGEDKPNEKELYQKFFYMDLMEVPGTGIYYTNTKINGKTYKLVPAFAQPNIYLFTCKDGSSTCKDSGVTFESSEPRDSKDGVDKNVDMRLQPTNSLFSIEKMSKFKADKDTETEYTFSGFGGSTTTLKGDVFQIQSQGDYKLPIDGYFGLQTLNTPPDYEDTLNLNWMQDDYKIRQDYTVFQDDKNGKTAIGFGRVEENARLKDADGKFIMTQLGNGPPPLILTAKGKAADGSDVEEKIIDGHKLEFTFETKYMVVPQATFDKIIPDTMKKISKDTSGDKALK